MISNFKETTKQFQIVGTAITEVKPSWQREGGGAEH
jgi:hypothetical protein